MNGHVDSSGRALLTVNLAPDATAALTPFEVWIDTGFTGELVLPRRIIDQLQLTESGSVDAILADGSQIELKTYSCLIEWFGTLQPLEIIANDGEFPLLGVGLLLGKELRINYHSLQVLLEVDEMSDSA